MCGIWHCLLPGDLVYVDVAAGRTHEQRAAIERPVQRSAPRDAALDWLIWVDVVKHVLVLQVPNLQNVGQSNTWQTDIEQLGMRCNCLLQKLYINISIQNTNTKMDYSWRLCLLL